MENRALSASLRPLELPMNLCLNVPYNLASASGPVELVCWVLGLVWNSEEILALGPNVELPG